MSLFMKFADMPCGVANRWLNFARSHDWGQNAGFLDTGAIAGCVEIWSDGREVEAPLFRTPREMRDWAGY